MNNRGGVIVLLVLCVVGVIWWLGEKLSSDAVAMAIGLAVGVFAFVPTMVLVSMAKQRDTEDEYIDIATMPTVYADQVTPYSCIARRAMGMPQLPDRQAEIDVLRSALAYLESEAQL